MKKLIVFVFFLTIFLNLNGQTNIFLNKGFSNEAKTLISKAKRDIQRGEKLMQYAKKNYEENSQLLESSKKAKQKKGEKKTLSGKKNLQQAALYYNKGYQQLFEVYFNYIANLKYDFPNNQTKAMKLRSQAEHEFNQGQRLLKSIRNYEEKELKRDVKFSKLIKTAQTGIDKELGAVKKLVQAIELYNQEAQQREQMKKQEQNFWQNVVSRNTIEAYQDYLNRYPNGSYVSEARMRIEELKKAKKQKNNYEQQNEQQNVQQITNKNLIYRIQVFASLKPVTPAKIRQSGYTLYGLDGRPTHSEKIGKYYKYFVGEYYTYDQANAEKEKIKAKMKKSNPFVVGFYNNKHIPDILQAIAIEKQLNSKN